MPIFPFSAEQLQMRLPIHVSHQSAAQLLWGASRVHFFRATLMHMDLGLSLRAKCTSSNAIACRRFRRCYFLLEPMNSL